VHIVEMMMHMVEIMHVAEKAMPMFL
jgi:hypothetical protein